MTLLSFFIKNHLKNSSLSEANVTGWIAEVAKSYWNTVYLGLSTTAFTKWNSMP
jgi:hypothetical protein